MSRVLDVVDSAGMSKADAKAYVSNGRGRQGMELDLRIAVDS